MKEKRIKEVKRTIPDNTADIICKIQDEFIDAYFDYKKAHSANNQEQVEINIEKLNKCFYESEQLSRRLPPGEFNGVGYLEFIEKLMIENPTWNKNEIITFVINTIKEVQKDRKKNKIEEKLNINQKYFEMVFMQLKDYATLILLHKKACETNNITQMTLLMDLINNARRNRCETFNDKDKKFCRDTLSAFEDAICQGMNVDEKDFMDLFEIIKSQK